MPFTHNGVMYISQCNKTIKQKLGENKDRNASGSHWCVCTGGKAMNQSLTCESVSLEFLKQKGASFDELF